ncbi:MAG: pyridoxal-phosphate dependent enzyme [Solirubrobacteraceae bacterium]
MSAPEQRNHPIEWAAEIEAARKRIAGIAVRTPLAQSPELSRRAGVPVLLKPEFIQPSGSFKLRGAANRMTKTLADGPVPGFVTFSTGNHARAVAWAAVRLGVPATVCVSRRVPPDKLAALRRLGATVIVEGASQDEAGALARRLEHEHGLAMVHPFDDAAVIAGQGTIGAELLEDSAELDAVLVPLSGGGLVAGIAAAVKARRPTVRVIGLSTVEGAAMVQSIRAGRPVEVGEADTLADSLGGGIGLDNAYTFGLVRDQVDELVLVEEADIARGLLAALKWERYILEGAAAIGLGAVIAGQVELRGPTALILTGRQIGLDTLAALTGVEEKYLQDSV